jgi:hypothetical protein
VPAMIILCSRQSRERAVAHRNKETRDSTQTQTKQTMKPHGLKLIKEGSQDVLISNPTSYRDSSPAHAANEAPSQTLSSRPTVHVSIRIIHRNGFRSTEGVLSASAHARVVSCAHHGGGSRVGVVIIGDLLALGGR